MPFIIYNIFYKPKDNEKLEG